jgi:hypothetical protein
MANPGPNVISADKILLSREAKLTVLTTAIEITAIGKQVGTIELVRVAFIAVGIILTKIKVSAMFI